MVVLAESNPPLAQDFDKILTKNSKLGSFYAPTKPQNENQCQEFDELPLIDLRDLTSHDKNERAKCAAKIARASSEWGFFQVINHGVSLKLLNQMRSEQINLFNASFDKKSTFGLLNNSYRWGTPMAKSTDHFSWSEAFHIPLTKIADHACYGEFVSLREVLVEYATEMQKLAKLLTEILITNLGQKIEDFDKMVCCDETTCFLRLNRYPICPLSQEMFGLVPHTDSDFLTILHQDQVEGLQLMKDSKWVPVNPNKDALIVNIGDLFQAWSNDLYKSVEHKVMANTKLERFSVAYFLCPSYDSLIKSCKEPSVYRNFTFGEYRSKVQEDVKLIGNKVGLPRFRL